MATNGIDDCQKTFSHCAWGVGAANNGKSRKKKLSKDRIQRLEALPGWEGDLGKK